MHKQKREAIDYRMKREKMEAKKLRQNKGLLKST